MDTLPKRKQIRLPDYDYSSAGAYFVTFCTQNKRCFLSEILVGAIHESPAEAVRLSAAGELVHQCIRLLPERFPELKVDHFVIMPNHVHLLLRIGRERAIRESPLQTEGNCKRDLLGKAIGFLKMNSSKQIHLLDSGLSVWQRSFYEHIIRNENDYVEIWEYIENNPLKWAQDRFYT